jgi:hypothetical protein
MEFRHNYTGGKYLHGEDTTQRLDDFLRAVSDSFWQVGVDMFQAMNEVAHDMGGDKFADEVVEVAFNGYDEIPNPDALKLLNNRDSEAAMKVMARSSEIQKERHKEELDARFPVRSRLRKFGKGLLDANTLLWTGQRLR